MSSDNKHPLRYNASGFTLVEVMLSLAVLVLLSGALFNVIRATLSAAAVLKETQKTRQQIFGFFELCQQTFPALPDSAVVVWNNPLVEGKTTSEITLRQAPQAFAWGESDSFYGEIAICTHFSADGSLILGIEQREIDPLTGLTLPHPTWLPLVYNLKAVTWTFYDLRTNKWQDFWSDTAQHPSLINLSLTFIAQNEVRAQSFWLPPLSAPPSTAAPAPTPVNSSQSNSSNPPPSSSPFNSTPGFSPLKRPLP